MDFRFGGSDLAGKEFLLPELLLWYCPPYAETFTALLLQVVFEL
jgi:hypothetical protein